MLLIVLLLICTTQEHHLNSSNVHIGILTPNSTLVNSRDVSMQHNTPFKPLPQTEAIGTDEAWTNASHTQFTATTEESTWLRRTLAALFLEPCSFQIGCYEPYISINLTYAFPSK